VIIAFFYPNEVFSHLGEVQCYAFREVLIKMPFCICMWLIPLQECLHIKPYNSAHSRDQAANGQEENHKILY